MGLDIVEMVMEVERVFGFEIPDEDAGKDAYGRRPPFLTSAITFPVPRRIPSCGSGSLMSCTVRVAHLESGLARKPALSKIYGWTRSDLDLPANVSLPESSARSCGGI